MFEDESNLPDAYKKIVYVINHKLLSQYVCVCVCVCV